MRLGARAATKLLYSYALPFNGVLPCPRIPACHCYTSNKLLSSRTISDSSGKRDSGTKGCTSNDVAELSNEFSESGTSFEKPSLNECGKEAGHTQLDQTLRNAAKPTSLLSSSYMDDIICRTKSERRLTALLDDVEEIIQLYTQETNTKSYHQASAHLHVAEELGLIAHRRARRFSPPELSVRACGKIGQHMLDILEHAEATHGDPITHKAQPNNDLTHRIKCVRIQALSLCGKVEDATKLLDELLDDSDSLIIKIQECHDKKKSLSSVADVESASSLENALGACLEGWIRMDRIHNGSGTKKEEHTNNTDAFPQDVAPEKLLSTTPAEKALLWFLCQPKALPLAHFSFPKISRVYSELITSIFDTSAFVKIILKKLRATSSVNYTSIAPRAVATIVLGLCNRHLSYEAFRVYRFAVGSGVRVPEYAGRRILRLATLERQSSMVYNLIPEIRSQVPKTKKGYQFERATLTTLAMFYAREGDLEALENCLLDISKFYPSNPPSREFRYQAKLLYYSMIGDVRRCAQLATQKYDFGGTKPEEERLIGLEEPDTIVWTRMIQANIRAGDLVEAEDLLERMLETKTKPTASIFNALLRAYAQRVDVPSALSLLQQMREANIRPDSVTYTTLVHLFALRQDPESAAHAIQSMKTEGIRPTQWVYVSLMDAHVESGSWDSAIEIFRWMCRQNSPRLRPSVAAYNTLLKSHVLRGAPVQNVFDLLRQIQQLGIEPDARTFALALRSTCDAGAMNLAENIFVEADKRLSCAVPGEGANRYHFSIMIHGYLRVGNTQDAKEYFDEMRRRGIAPSSVSWAVLVKAYASSGSKGNLQLAYDLVSSLVEHALHGEKDKGRRADSWFAPAIAEGEPIEMLFSPIALVHTKQDSPEEVEHLIYQLTELGGDVTMRMLTILLDAYRRVEDVSSAFRVWERIYKEALDSVWLDTSVKPKSDPRSSTSQTEKTPSDSGRRNILCLPISIIIDLLSKTGRHEEVARVWTRAKTDGFGFDPHNWNHFTVALVRANRLKDALHVIEHVLPDAPPSYGMPGLRGSTPHSNHSNTVSLNESTVDPTSLRHKEEAEMREFRTKDATRTPARTPNRRHQNRFPDNIHSSLPFDDQEDHKQEELDDTMDDQDSSRSSHQGLHSLQHDLIGQLHAYGKFEQQRSLWYAHYHTLEVVNEALLALRKQQGGLSSVARSTESTQTDSHSGQGSPISYSYLLWAYPKAARVLAAHQRRLDSFNDRARTGTDWWHASAQEDHIKRWL